MKKIFLITLALIILNATNLFDTNIFSGSENFADAQRNILQSETTKTENFAQEVLQLVNVEREKAGLKPLKLSDNMNRFAEVRARELPKKFSHTRPDGSQCFTVITISYRYAGENIAAGQRDPKTVVDSWMNSEGHRENILNPNFSQLGVGYLYAPETEYKYFWVQLFKG